MDPEYSFGQSISHPRDYLTIDERKRIREAALEYGSVPNYNAVTPDERDKWKTHLTQRFEKSKSEVTRQDWKRANGWKIPSLVWTSLDTGLRPIDIDNHVLRIPKDESSKNHENWIVDITEI